MQIKHLNILFVLLISACNSQSSQHQADLSNLDMFKRLAMAQSGLNFPHTKDQLEHCRQMANKSCLSSFSSFQEAKSKLSQLPRREALDLTLIQLSESCVVEAPSSTKLACTGTLMALYFFSDATDDQAIRQWLSELPESTFANVIDRSASLSLCWLENRPDSSIWIEWMESILTHSSIKARAIYRIEHRDPKSDPLKKFPYNIEGQ